ncbi:hypothetical protein GGR54DRAFT_625646 [Hypoxylon sp. NC1633]|nr:hypothetical protein GGR54DRAFT_625646 [Hypoxylon sp. NC1633]
MDPTVQSFLACAHCAKSKAKCDRKIPCTRCVGKKLQCQTRMSQRGGGRLFFDTAFNRSNTVESETNDRSPTIIVADAATATAAVAAGGGGAGGGAGGDLGSGTTPTPPEDQTTYGVYMDWSRNLSSFRPSTRSRTTDNVAPEDDFLAQLVAATSGADENYLYPTDYQPDFAVPTKIPPPVSQPGTDQWKHSVGFPASSATTTQSSNDYNADDNVPTVPSMPWLESALADVDRLQTLEEAWPLFQCNPVIPSSACTPTAAHSVKSLPVFLKDASNTASQGRLVHSKTVVEPLQAHTREKLIAVLQSLFNEAQQLYGLRGPEKGMGDWVGTTVLMLPPPPRLEFLFRTFLDCYEQYYPFIPTALRGINERMEDGSTILPSILLLLMLAAGAKAAGSGETYPQIAHGLVEICRISLRGLIEQNIKLASDSEVLECALLLTIVAVWSGDKWQMDVALYQKAMFLEMHLRAGFHDDRDVQVARLESSNDVARSWEIWKEQERANRTTYGWLVLDHELCLFQDIPSTLFFAVGRLNTPIPSPDATWSIPSPKHWVQDTLPLAGQYHVRVPPSLNQWTSCFSETNDVNSMTHVSPTTLRLLLCHLHNLVIQLRISIDGISSEYQTHRSLRHPRAVLLSVQVQEAQELLNKWYDLAKTLDSGEASSSAMAANLILYHFIVLNTMLSFPEIERLARTSESDTSHRISRSSRSIRPYHLENTRDIYFHCGQILRNIRSVQGPARPPWWAGAVYRVALTAWANSKSNPDTDTRNEEEMETDETVLLDVLPADHASIAAYLNHRGGVPAFSGSNGASVYLDEPIDILRHCAGLFDTDIKTSFTDGIQIKLQTMARRWETRNP